MYGIVVLVIMANWVEVARVASEVQVGVNRRYSSNLFLRCAITTELGQVEGRASSHALRKQLCTFCAEGPLFFHRSCARVATLAGSVMLTWTAFTTFTTTALLDNGDQRPPFGPWSIHAGSPVVSSLPMYTYLSLA